MFKFFELLKFFTILYNFFLIEESIKRYHSEEDEPGYFLHPTRPGSGCRALMFDKINLGRQLVLEKFINQ